jgi:beta-lactamase superfamily II metal-dependent hydrolase
MKNLIQLFFLSLLPFLGVAQDKQFLKPWEKGMLDIHFISTGVGNCAFYVLPDGTTMIVDAGELDPTSPRTNSPRNTPRYPNYSKSGFEWQVDYISDALRKLNKTGLDYALISHFHDDHFGGLYSGAPSSENGKYLLTGITGVGDKIKIGKLIDRGYNYPVDMKQQAKLTPTLYRDMINYWNFSAFQEKANNLKVEELRVGSKDQISLLNDPKSYPDFHIRNINANGRVWTGKNDGSFTTRMPSDNSGKSLASMPGENPLSCGILIKYGRFSFYTGGDVAGSQPEFMKAPEYIDVERLIAPAVGEVDVTTCNHHANRDAMSAYYLSVLKPRVIVQEVWSSDHPGHESLLRLTSKNIWPAERDLFATNMLEANKLVIGELVDRSYKSMQGHVVVRVFPPGDTYAVYILNHLNIERNLINVFGPYRSKEK